jgi:cyclohexyl-isocyanide hydratase
MQTSVVAASAAAGAVEPEKPLEIGLLLFPRLTQLDLTGPFEVFSRLSNTRVHLIWKSLDPVKSDSGLSLLPTMTIAACPRLDVICVPGGPGQVPLMDDAETLDFVRRQGLQAKWVTSVCTGSLVVGAAGLLKGYRSACHWMSRNQLSELGAKPVAERIVVDRNRVSGGGVTAGIDFALKLASLLRSEREARMIQLQIEYDPAPPFAGGTPETSDPDLVSALVQRAEPMLKARKEATLRAKVRLEKQRGH